MSFKGTIDKNSSSLLPRLLERIFDEGNPGRLEFKHKESELTATLVLDADSVTEMRCGQTTGDEAMTQIRQTFPWEYEFVPDASSATATRSPSAAAPLLGGKAKIRLGSVDTAPSSFPDSGIEQPLHLPPAADASPPAPADAPRKVLKLTPVKPAATLVASPAPTPIPTITLAPIPEAKPASVPDPTGGSVLPTTGTPVADVPASSPPILAEEPVTLPLTSLQRVAMPEPAHQALVDWASDGASTTTRFYARADETFGKVDPSAWEYFRMDQAYLVSSARAIGRALGYSPPLVVAVSEAVASTGYRVLNGNAIAGALASASEGVEAVVNFPDIQSQ